MEDRKAFAEYLQKRMETDSASFFDNAVIQKAYYVGAYARAVILSSYNSEVSKGNTTFKTWLSNQIINFRNLDRIFEMSFRFEQKLKLRIRNDSEVRRLAHQAPPARAAGISSAKISYAFVAGFDDYMTFMRENPTSIDKDSQLETDEITKP